MGVRNAYESNTACSGWVRVEPSRDIDIMRTDLIMHCFQHGIKKIALLQRDTEMVEAQKTEACRARPCTLLVWPIPLSASWPQAPLCHVILLLWCSAQTAKHWTLWNHEVKQVFFLMDISITSVQRYLIAESIFTILELGPYCRRVRATWRLTQNSKVTEYSTG